ILYEFYFAEIIRHGLCGLRMQPEASAKQNQHRRDRRSNHGAPRNTVVAPKDTPINVDFPMIRGLRSVVTPRLRNGRIIGLMKLVLTQQRYANANPTAQVFVSLRA